MTIEYCQTVDDAVQQALLDSRRDPRVRTIRRGNQRSMLLTAAAMMVALALMVAVNLDSGVWSYADGLFTGFAASSGVLMVWGAVSMFRSSRVLERVVRRHSERLRLGPRRITLRATHMEVLGEHFEVRHGWPDLAEVVEDAEMLAIVDRYGALALAVPERAFADATQRAGFIGQVRERLVAAAPPTAGGLGVAGQ